MGWKWLGIGAATAALLATGCRGHDERDQTPKPKPRDVVEAPVFDAAPAAQPPSPAPRPDAAGPDIEIPVLQ